VAESIRQYELCCLARPDLEPEALDGLVESIQSSITNRGGEVLRTDRWNKRMLAFPIRKYTEGYYIIVRWLSGTEVLPELNYQMRYSDAVLRHLIMNYTETERKRGKRLGHGKTKTAQV
jgi:small subunit ribosomal protein S6